MRQFFQPDLLLQNGSFVSGVGVLSGEDGRVEAICAADDPKIAAAARVRLKGRALLPGMVNAHSHSFQRLIRGRSENRAENGDTFWTWREAMYRAAATLTPEEVYAVARVTFLEMLRAGITTVGEFHYIHRAPDGSAYDDGNLLAKQIVAAARSVGMRIVLLRSAYFRAGYELPPHPGQRRFYERRDEYLANTEALRTELACAQDRDSAWTGVAPHSIRAVPLDDLREIVRCADGWGMPVHMHAAEQPAELRASEAEYGMTPVRLLAEHGLLSDRAVLVHAIHIDETELQEIAQARATICSCPTTERNLGDGVIDARRAAEANINFAYGTDSQAQIDLLEDARQLDYHQRLVTQERALLDGIRGEAMAQRLFRYATEGGARALGFDGGALEPGRPADFFTVNLDDLSIAGADAHDLLPTIVFGAAKSAVRDVGVRGRLRVEDGRQAHEAAIVADYRRVRDRVWQRI